MTGGSSGASGGSGGGQSASGGSAGAAAAGGVSGAAAGGASPGAAQVKLFPQANSSSSYAISQAGEIWSWGVNDNGQLGHATGAAPAAVTALGMNAVAYAGGEIHAIAISNDGSGFTFGVNYSGQLGITDGTGVFGSHPTPEKVGLPTGVKALPFAAAGERYSSLLGDDGNIYIWGGNLYGQQANQTNIGNMTANPMVHAVPKPTGVTSWKGLGGGYSHLFGLAQDDQLWVWGDNRRGQLGVGMTQPTPDGMLKAVMKPAGVTAWRSAVGGRDFSLALSSDGALFAWGANDMGQLANAAGAAAQAAPAPIDLPAGATGWKKVAAGKDHAAAITTEGKLYTWGKGSGAMLKEIPAPAGAVSWVDVSAGVALVIATGADGKVYQWTAGATPTGPVSGLP